MSVGSVDANQSIGPVVYDEERVEALLANKKPSAAHLVMQLSGIYQELHKKTSAELAEAMTQEAHAKGKDSLLQKAISTLQDVAQKLQQDPEPRLHTAVIKTRIQQVALFLSDIDKAKDRQYEATLRALPPLELVEMIQMALLEKNAKQLRLIANAKEGSVLLLTRFIQCMEKSAPAVFHQAIAELIQWVLPENIEAALVHAYFAKIMLGAHGKETGRFIDSCSLELLNNHMKEGGKTALHCAAEKGALSAVMALLDKGASPTAETSGGSHPLAFACWQGHVDVASILIDLASNEELQHTDRDGKSALDWAIEAGVAEIEKKLRERGIKPSDHALTRNWIAACAERQSEIASEAQDVANSLINFCFTVLDSTKVNLALDGGSEAAGLRYAGNSLRRYLQEQGTQLSAGEKETVEQALLELEAAEERCHQLRALGSLKNPEEQRASIRVLARQFSNGVKQLLENPDKEARFVLPGGYRSKKEGGHFVIVEIRVNPVTKNSLELSIINTGAGIQNELLDLEGLRSAELHGRPMFQDIKYVNLQPADLSSEFFMEYIQQSYIRDSSSMQPFLGFIQKACLKVGSDGKDNRAVGRAHKIQKKGSCSVKATQSWIHHRLGRTPYFRYKVEMTKYQIEKLQAIGKSALEYTTPAELEAMQRAAEKVQQKRIQKLEQLLLAEAPSPRVTGDLFAREKEWKEAIQFYTEWAEKTAPEKKNLPSLFLWIEAHMALHEFGKAKAVLARVDALTQGDAVPNLDLLEARTKVLWALFENTGDHRELLAFVEKAEVAAIAHPVVVLHHVKMLFALKRYEKAAALSLKAQESDSESLDLHILQAKALFNQNKPVEVLQVCEKIKALGKDHRGMRFVQDMDGFVERLLKGEKLTVS